MKWTTNPDFFTPPLQGPEKSGFQSSPHVATVLDKGKVVRSAGYYQRLRERGRTAYLVMVGAESYCLLHVVTWLVINGSGRTMDSLFKSILQLPWHQVMLWGPLWETVCFQMLIVELIKGMTHRTWPGIALSMLAFSSAHFAGGMESGLTAGIIGGFYYAVTYSLWAEKGRMQGMMMTFLMHSLHNTLWYVIAWRQNP